MTNYAKGLDVSQWQGDAFPFDKAAQEGYSFTYIRASVRSHQDPVYHIHRARALHAGLMTGSYHYLYANPSPRAQALTFFETVQRQEHQPDQLPPALDVEENTLNEGHLLTFISAWHQLTHAPLAIYTSRRKWHQVLDQNAAWPAHYTLWVADWRGFDEPAIPCPWQDWTFWQWTAKGRIPDYPGPVDLNYYNGTERQLKDRYMELWT